MAGVNVDYGVFERRKEQSATHILWRCRSCWYCEETNGEVTRNKCPRCKTWMEWEPILYAGEIKQ